MLADTSVVINLDASGYFNRILEALPNRLLISEIVENEVRRGEIEGARQENGVWEIIACGQAEVVALTCEGLWRFRSLTSGRAVETLGDGEAATIACALELGAAALIDERKGLRISAQRFPSLVTATTLDALAHPQVQSALGMTSLSEAVFNALTRARMRVPQQYYQWVVDLIGADNARKCNSLPRSVRLHR
jgi:predicted nucleic acid-binding protein